MTSVEPPITPPGVITQEFHTARDVRRGVIAGVASSPPLGALPAIMAELAPWRVRCTVVAVAHNLAARCR